MSESYPPPDQATWRTAPVTAGPSDTSPFQLPPEFYDAEPAGGQQPSVERRNKLLLQGLGLVGVAVLSGLIFWAVQPGRVAGVAEAKADSQAVVAGKYSFTRVAGPATDVDCAKHAFGKTQTFLQQHPCQQLVRSVYSTTLPGGTVVGVSVVDVKMPNADAAELLRQLTNGDKTGNVNDLLRDGGVSNGTMPTSDQLQNGGYAAGTTGDVTTIALSAFVGGQHDQAALKDVSADALKLTGR